MTHKYKKSTSLVDNIGNFMFLEKGLNINKTNKLPEDYFREAKDQYSNLDYDFYETNCIPRDFNLHKPENFEDFVKERRKLIFDSLKDVLKY